MCIKIRRIELFVKPRATLQSMQITVIFTFFARYHFHFSSNPFNLFSLNSNDSWSVHTQKQNFVICFTSSGSLLIVYF